MTADTERLLMKTTIITMETITPFLPIMSLRPPLHYAPTCANYRLTASVWDVDAFKEPMKNGITTPSTRG